MSAKRYLASAVTLAVAAAVSGCASHEQTVGVAVGGIGDIGGVTGVSYMQQYSVDLHQYLALSLGYTNPRNWDAVALQADLVAFGRVPEASCTSMYVGFGLGLGMWTADSPTGEDWDLWLRVPVGVVRRFTMDNGEAFFEVSPAIGLGKYQEESVFGFAGGVRWKLGY